MGLEPTTFCMARRRQLLGRRRFVPANGALLRRGDESFFPRVWSRFDGIVSPKCPRRPPTPSGGLGSPPRVGRSRRAAQLRVPGAERAARGRRRPGRRTCRGCRARLVRRTRRAVHGRRVGVAEYGEVGSEALGGAAEPLRQRLRVDRELGRYGSHVIIRQGLALCRRR